MNRIALLGAMAAWGMAHVASAAPMKAFDAATGSPVVVTVKPMTNAEVGVTAAEPQALPFQVSAPGYESVVVFQNRENLAGLSDRVIALCRNGAVDTDGDTLCDEAEDRYGTNVSKTDTDGDRFSDAAEIMGFNGFDMASKGALAAAPNLFLELDYYPGQRPTEAGVQKIIAAFARQGITLSVEIDDQVRQQDVDLDLNPVFQEFGRLENIYRDQEGMAYWGLMGFAYNNGGSSGVARGIPCDAFLVSVGRFRNQGTALQRDATIMHEFGHCLGLQHGGRNNEQYVPNFFSLMSYSYQLVGLTIGGQPEQFDYASFSLAGVNEANFNEVAGLNPVSGITEQELSRYTVRLRRGGNVTGSAASNLDLSRDGRISPAATADLDSDGRIESFPQSRNEFATLVFGGNGRIGDRLVSEEERQTIMPAGMTPTAAEDMEACMSESDL